MLKALTMKHAKKNQETKVYGRHACQKLFEKRPDDIVRAYLTEEGVFTFRSMMKHLAEKKVAYHLVEKEEIDNITKATHHEGICLIVKNKVQPTLKELLETKGRNLILALEVVENPHNLGAIMRSAAHFGVSGILYEAKVPVANSAAAIRTSEGGYESVSNIQVEDWNMVMDIAKRQGYSFFATSSHEGTSLYETEFPDKTILFLGAEGEGLSNKMMKKMTNLMIPGTGEVESLNVSNATVTLLSEWYRQGL